MAFTDPDGFSIQHLHADWCPSIVQTHVGPRFVTGCRPDDRAFRRRRLLLRVLRRRSSVRTCLRPRLHRIFESAYSEEDTNPNNVSTLYVVQIVRMTEPPESRVPDSTAFPDCCRDRDAGRQFGQGFEHYSIVKRGSSTGWSFFHI